MGIVRKTAVVIVGTFFKLLYRHKVYGTENMPKGAAIIASNHCSFYDPPIIGVSSTDYIHFLARGSLFRFPLFAWLLRELATHPVARGKGNTETFKKAYAFLNNGEKVAIFPEGKRSKDGMIGEGLLGTSVLVMRSRALVVPTYVHGTYEIWNARKKFPKLKGRMACVFGKPIDFSDLFSLEDKKEAQKLIVAKIMDAIKKLREWYLAGAHGTPP